VNVVLAITREHDSQKALVRPSRLKRVVPPRHHVNVGNVTVVEWTVDRPATFPLL